MNTSAQHKQIIQQSRRGLKELDVILENFNQQTLAKLTTQQLQQYMQLLKQEDHDLLQALMHTPSTNPIIKIIMDNK